MSKSSTFFYPPKFYLTRMIFSLTSVQTRDVLSKINSCFFRRSICFFLVGREKEIFVKKNDTMSQSSPHCHMHSGARLIYNMYYNKELLGCKRQTEMTTLGGSKSAPKLKHKTCNNSLISPHIPQLGKETAIDLTRYTSYYCGLLGIVYLAEKKEMGGWVTVAHPCT